MSDILLQLEKLLYPKADFTGKTVIVVGSNTGMGKEAVRHFVRLNALKVIIGVRSISKGLNAQEDIEATTNRHGVTEVWEIDLASSASVKEFVKRVAALSRVDAVVSNASIAIKKFELLENNESMVTVNVINTMLLVLLLIPILQVSALRWNIIPVITVVGSDIHSWTNLPAWKSPNILECLKSKNSRVLGVNGYAQTKLMQIFAVREIAPRMTEKGSKVALNIINPGLAKTELTRYSTGVIKIVMGVSKVLLARTAEEAGRTLVHAASVGMESHGLYFTNCDVTRNPLSKFVTSEDGGKAQKKLWGELEERFEKIEPGIMTNL